MAVMKPVFRVTAKYFGQDGIVRQARTFEGNFAKYQEEGGLIFDAVDGSRIKLVYSLLAELEVINIENTPQNQEHVQAVRGQGETS